jgi:GNAT superfamily N-acetyltransferase
VPVGHVGLVLPDEREVLERVEAERLPTVHDLEVLPAHRRKGTGRALMLAIQAEARARGFARLWLGTGLDDGYAPARALYRSLDWVEESDSLCIQSSRVPTDDGPSRPYLEIITAWRLDLTPGFAVRLLDEDDIEALNRELPAWSSAEYARRLRAQHRAQMVQAVAWEGDVPVGRGMVLFPGHEEWSVSAEREGCAEVRDVWVAPGHRRKGIARALMGVLERAARDAGMSRIGLAVSLEDGAAPARALYDVLGYRQAHGPFVSSTDLAGDGGPIAVGAVLTFLTREL